MAVYAFVGGKANPEAGKVTEEGKKVTTNAGSPLGQNKLILVAVVLVVVVVAAIVALSRRG